MPQMTCRLGNSEAVFQHLKPDNLTIGDGEHDGEVRRDDLAVSLEWLIHHDQMDEIRMMELPQAVANRSLCQFLLA